MNILPEVAEPAVSAFQNLSPDEILDAVESQGYLCDGGFQALNSYENRVYQLGIEDGQPLIAKFYRPARWDNDAIQEEHDFTRELVASELPVVAPLYNARGESIHQHGEFRFSLYPRVSGRTPELDNPDQLEVIGRFLARIHLHGEQADFKHRPAIDIESYGTGPSQFLLTEKKLPSGIEPAYLNLIDDLLAKIKDHFSAAGSVQQLRIHGDCHRGNVLWTEAGPWFVDFDDCVTAPPIADCWMLLDGEEHERREQLAILIEAYEEFHEFDWSSTRLIEPLRTARIIEYAAWIAHRWPEPAFAFSAPFEPLWILAAHVFVSFIILVFSCAHAFFNSSFLSASSLATHYVIHLLAFFRRGHHFAVPVGPILTPVLEHFLAFPISVPDCFNFCFSSFRKNSC